jgi:hypothetical protein
MEFTEKGADAWTESERIQFQEVVARLFRDFCDADGHIDSSALVISAKGCNLLGSKLSESEVGLIFQRVKLGKRQWLDLKGFEEALRQMAVAKGVAFAAMVASAATFRNHSSAFYSLSTSQRKASMKLNMQGGGQADVGRLAFYNELGLETIRVSLNKSAQKINHVSAKAEDELEEDATESSTTGSAEAVVVKAGWLTKKGAKVKNWKRRWFVLRSSCESDTLSYYSKEDDSSALGVIKLTSTSQVTRVASEAATKEYEFTITPMDDSKKRTYCMHADSNHVMLEWIQVIQSAIAGQMKETMMGSTGDLWKEGGIRPFIVHHQAVSDSNSAVIEFNFVDGIVHTTRNGNARSSFRTQDIVKVAQMEMKDGGRGSDGSSRNLTKRLGQGIEITLNGPAKPVAFYAENNAARDHLTSFIEFGQSSPSDQAPLLSALHENWRQLNLKMGFLERRDDKQQLWMVLREDSLYGYPSAQEAGGRPWLCFARLSALSINRIVSQKVITIGRDTLVCSSGDECEEWYQAISSAAGLSALTVTAELTQRKMLRENYHEILQRLRELILARVSISVAEGGKEAERVETMLQELWLRIFPDHPWESVKAERWKELGFQRAGPASDLRGSGLLGLHILVYFVREHKDAFDKMIQGQKEVSF